MKITIAVATFMVVGAGAAGAGALAEPNPYQGSDTLFNVTRQALAGDGLSSGGLRRRRVRQRRVGDGRHSGHADHGAHVPHDEGRCGLRFRWRDQRVESHHASGIVLALDAVDILGSTNTAASTACGGGSAGGGGILNSGGAIAASTWKDALALVYGGKDNENGGAIDCNSAHRISLVANWASLFQNSSCSNTVATCKDGNHRPAPAPG